MGVTFGIKITNIHGSSNSDIMLTKFIIHFDLSKGGISLDRSNIYFLFQYSNPFITSFKISPKTPFPLDMRFSIYFQIPLILTWNFQIKETDKGN